MDFPRPIVFPVKTPAAEGRWENRWEEANMKKWKIGVVIAAAVVALVGSTTAYAAGGGGRPSWNTGSSASALATAYSWDGRCGWGGWNECWAYGNGDGICGRYGAWYTGGGYCGRGHCRW